MTHTTQRQFLTRLEVVWGGRRAGQVRERNKKVRAEGWGDEELVEAFVAIDDRALLQERGGDRLHGHFVMTHPYVLPPLFHPGCTRSLAKLTVGARRG
jgi:hypothetical protein